MADPDEQVIRQAVQGDDQALTALLERHGARVRRWLAGNISKRWQSLISEDDVMQQTYVDAFRDIRRFVGRGQDSFACWLETLAQRNLYDAVRMLEAEKRGGARRRVEPRSMEESVVALCEVLGGSVTTPSRKAAGAEAQFDLMSAIKSLPEAYRQVIEMYDLEAREIEEVAAELKRSCGAVYMLRARAHRLLGEMMGSASKYFSKKA